MRKLSTVNKTAGNGDVTVKKQQRRRRLRKLSTVNKTAGNGDVTVKDVTVKKQQRRRRLRKPKKHSRRGHRNPMRHIDSGDHTISGDVNVHDRVNLGVMNLGIGEGTLTRIGYILVGFDIFRGNPLSSKGVDPGFRTIPIMNAIYSGKTTSDKLNKLPDGVWARQTLSCEKSSTTRVFQSLSSYITEMESHLGIAVDFMGYASVGLNSELNSKNSHLDKMHETVIQTVATCNVYQLALDIVKPPPPNTHRIIFRSNRTNHIKYLR